MRAAWKVVWRIICRYDTIPAGPNKLFCQPDFLIAAQTHVVPAIRFIGEIAIFNMYFEGGTDKRKIEESFQAVEVYVPSVVHRVMIWMCMAKFVEGDAVLTLANKIILTAAGCETAAVAVFAVWISEF